MPSSSIPKHSLIRLILTELQAAPAAASRFHISTSSSIYDRLMSFSKPALISFIGTLGPEAESSLEHLESAFPLRRPPTLYLAFMESSFDVDSIVEATRSLAKENRKAALLTGKDEPIQAVFVDQRASVLALKGKSALQIPLRYERRIDFIVADPLSELYGMPSSVTSLETAFIWIPMTRRPKHAVIASCDYPVLRHLLSFALRMLGLRLYLTYLDLDTLRTLVGGATPRSATFTTTFDDPEEVKTLTISDPVLSSKPVFTSAAKSSVREQTAGFYVNHPGLPTGGMGVSRREGRVWIPSRLDHTQLASLALQLIEQTEGKLKARSDTNVLVTHYYSSRARIGDKEVTGPPHRAWMDLLRVVIHAAEHPDRQSEITLSLLERLIRFQTQLFLVPALVAECPSCGYSSLATCPTCHVPLSLKLSPSIEPFCRTVLHDASGFICDCGTELSPSLPTDAYIVPEPPLVESICRAVSVITDRPFDSFFNILGTLLRLSPAIPPSLAGVISLSDLAYWKLRAHINTVNSPPAHERKEFIRILNRTKEKCFRDEIRPSIIRCSECKANAIESEWLLAGDLCLPRLLGVAIDERFDGVHHGHELADIKYLDTISSTGAPIRLGVHLKSRLIKPPPLGVGRSKYPVKGLYAQLAFSAYKTESSSAKLDVIGVAIPNVLLPEVTDSMQFAVNKMGFSFISVTEEDWLKIVRIAEEKIASGP